jgi:hypothetical protein
MSAASQTGAPPRLRDLRLRGRWLALSGGVTALIVALAIATGAASTATTTGAAPFGQPGGAFNGARPNNPFSVQRNGRDAGLDQAIVAQTLGIAVSQLQQELAGGATYSQIIASHGGTLDAVVSALLRPYQTQLTQQVAASRLTQAQADALLAAREGQLRSELTGGR